MAVSAVVGGSALVAGVGAISSSNASRTAAAAQDHAASLASNTQMNMFNQEQANAAPWIQSGNNALNSLNSQMPDLTRQFTAQDFQSNPGYQFQLQQGQQAIQRSAASKGLLNSVGTQQNLDAYSQGMANTDYQQALNNFTGNQQQRYNMLSGLSQQGLAGATLTNQAAMNAGNNISNNQMAAGNASAAATIGSSNALSSGLSSVANNGMSYSMFNQLMNNPNSNMNVGYLGGNYGTSPMSMPQLGQAVPPQSYGSSLGTYDF